MLDSLPLAKAGIETKDIGGETLLICGDDIHVLNTTAALIWKLCDGQHTLADIEEAVCQEYAVPEDRDVMADIKRALEDFKSKDLLSDSKPDHANQ